MDVTRRYQCACGYGTDVKRCYVEHRRTHTDERPYVCECGARFRRSNHLASHQKRKIITIDHNNEKILQCRPVKKRAKPTNPNGGTARPWKCECGSTFKWHHLLVSHQRGYSCPVKPPVAKQPVQSNLSDILHEKNVDIRLPRISSIVSPPSPPIYQSQSQSPSQPQQRPQTQAQQPPVQALQPPLMRPQFRFLTPEHQHAQLHQSSQTGATAPAPQVPQLSRLQLQQMPQPVHQPVAQPVAQNLSQHMPQMHQQVPQAMHAIGVSSMRIGQPQLPWITTPVAVNAPANWNFPPSRW